MATYTFEHVNRRKATSLSADRRNLLDGRYRAYPNDNYLSGDGKSNIWAGHGYYSPTNREWFKHHEVKALPNARKPDKIEFENEDKWRAWQRTRDTPGSGKYCASSGFRNAGHPSGTPELKLNGYAFNPFNLYRTGTPAISLYNPHNPWPKTEARAFPTWRGPPGYYGYYHEELDTHNKGGYRFPRNPKMLQNEEDLKKYEFFQNMPTLHNKLPAEFPVLQ